MLYLYTTVSFLYNNVNNLSLVFASISVQGKEKVSSIANVMSLFGKCSWYVAKSNFNICEGWSCCRIRTPALFHQLFPLRIASFWNRRPERIIDNTSFIKLVVNKLIISIQTKLISVQIHNLIDSACHAHSWFGEVKRALQLYRCQIMIWLTELPKMPEKPTLWLGFKTNSVAWHAFLRHQMHRVPLKRHNFYSNTFLDDFIHKLKDYC